jgi:hypothetical protein
MRRMLLSALMLSGVAGFGPAPALSAPLDEVLAGTIGEIAQSLKDRGIDKVIPKYNGVLTFPGGNVQGMTEKVKEGLAPYGIQISSRADHVLETRFVRSDEESERAFRLRFEGTLVDKRGRAVASFKSQDEVDDGKDLAELTGTTAHFRPHPNGQSRGADFLRDLDKHTIFVANESTRLFSSQEAQFGIELKVRGTPRRFREKEEGLAYVTLDQGEEYALVLFNNSRQEMSVTLKVDGVNVFHFCEEREFNFTTDKMEPKFSKWVIPPGQKAEILGWFKSSRTTSRFRITPVEEGAAAIAGLPLDEVGIVTATFQASWPESQSPPRDEPFAVVMGEAAGDEGNNPGSAAPSSPAPSSPDSRSPAPTSAAPPTLGSARPKQVNKDIATGFGEEIRTNFNGVKREHGVPRATIAFRYEKPE